MNNINIEPKNLVTISVASIINEIVKCKNTNIYMLENEIPSTLFKILEMTTLSMFNNYKNPNDVNLERIKNLLPTNIFLQHVQIYLNTMIEHRRIGFNIHQIRDNVPENIYTLFLKEYLKDEICWNFFFNDIFDMEEKDIFQLLDSSTISTDVYLLITNIPDRIADNLADENYHIVLEFWQCNVNSTNLTYCKNCVATKQNIYKRIECMTSTGEEFIRSDLRHPKHWCSECLYMPLFKIIDGYYKFVSTEYIGNYSNSRNLW